ncbi:MAG: PD-(D/E)XK nuclease family protein [Treponemataceae bacterium]|nr:PD-(D/E)XK nuclease family protein [Treponemataceae bacterium]
MQKNLIEKVLCEHIKEQESFFVFPTQMAADRWADRATLVTSVTAVAVERFKAWDSFKSESIRSSHQDKRSVPAAMRRIFASSLIKENARKAFLSFIITEEYSKSAGPFLDWITKLLPELALWKRLFDSSGKVPDEEDRDYLQLYDRYKAFLEKYGFFDPAWETPPFKPDGNHYFIFFPEILSDYFVYEDILKSSPDITLVNLPEDLSEEKDGYNYSLEELPVLFFNNSRSELKYIASLLMELHEKKKLPWNEIAVSVPDLESYGAYVSRELSLYEIPHVIRNAKELSATGAGCLFSLIRQCASSGCDYKSLYNLLLDRELPWKDLKENRRLLEFGRENHCICNFEYKKEHVKVWEKSFADNFSLEEKNSSSGKKSYVSFLRSYFRSLHSSIEALSQSSSFEKLRENYFAFRERFFDMTKCPARSDLILSRCIKELGGLIDLEKEYFSDPSSEYRPEDPFSFFTDYISGIQYLEQTERTGVQILPYKLASCAPFDCQIVVDTSQDAVSVVYEGLHFLQETKRRFLTKRDEINCSEKFLQLYMMNSIEHEVCFTAAEKTFTGYAQVSSCLSEKKPESASFLDSNPYAAEKRWLLSSGGKSFPEKELFPKHIPESMKSAFERWLCVQGGASPAETAADEATRSRSGVEESVSGVGTAGIDVEATGAGGEAAVRGTEKISISKTSLSSFFFCPYSWLFEYGFKLKEQDDAATLMNSSAYGKLYHKIFELFMTRLKEKGLLLDIDDDGKIPGQYEDIMNTSIDEAIVSVDSWRNVYENCYLSRELLNSNKKAITEIMMKALMSISKTFKGCVVDEVEEVYSVQLKDKSYSINGRIDCLLRDPDKDRYFLVDYKTTKAPPNFLPEKKEEGDSPEPQELPLMQQKLPDFQIPIYLLLLRNGEKKRVVSNACFFIVGKGEVINVFGTDLFKRNPPQKKKEINPVTPEDFEEFVEKTLECMDFYAECISSGKIETDPEVQNFMRCIGCKYKGLCRKTFNVGRKD